MEIERRRRRRRRKSRPFSTEITAVKAWVSGKLAACKQALSNLVSKINMKHLLIALSIVLAALVVLLVICSVTIWNKTDKPTGNTFGSSDSSSNSSGASSSVVESSSTVFVPPTSSVVTIPSTAAPTLPPIPDGDNYTDMDTGYIAEVIQANVETYNPKTNDNYSIPLHNYLPKGTVDYCRRELVTSSEYEYVLLRSGHRIHVQKPNYPPSTSYADEVKRYEGTLPDHNEIGMVSWEIVGHHTILTLDCLWKAPFYFETNQTGYANPTKGSDRNYAVNKNNISYVDITFCYATAFTGDVSIPADHPLFKSAELIRNESDYTLRLHMNKAGGFYGWHAYYNDNGQLCFQFLNPVQISVAENKYGADLTGVKVFLDVGHGGGDSGATATDLAGIRWRESELNLLLGTALQKELESMGATVIINRTGETSIQINTRIKELIDAAPDICIAIHQNSESSHTSDGFDSMYFTPWSRLPAKNIQEYTKEASIYNRASMKWSVNYFLMRQTTCPVILTENGYMSNSNDLTTMTDLATIEKKAVAIAHGVADYFMEISQ